MFDTSGELAVGRDLERTLQLGQPVDGSSPILRGTDRRQRVRA